MKNQLLHQSVSIIIQLHQQLKAQQSITQDLAQELIETANQIEQIQKAEINQNKYIDYSKDVSVQKTISKKRVESIPLNKYQSPQCKEIFSRECLSQLILPFLNLEDLILFRCVNSSIQEIVKQYVKLYLPKEEKSLAHHLFSSYYLISLKEYLFQFIPSVEWFVFDHIQIKRNIQKLWKDYEVLKKIKQIPQKYETMFQALVNILQGIKKYNGSHFEQFKKINLKQKLKYENLKQNIDQFKLIDCNKAKIFSIELYNTIVLCQNLISLFYLENIFTIGSNVQCESHQFNQISYYYKYHSDIINFWKRILHQDQKFQLFLDFTQNKIRKDEQTNSTNQSQHFQDEKVNIIIECLSYCDNSSLLKCRLINKRFKNESENELKQRLIYFIQAYEFSKLFQNRQYKQGQAINELGFFNPLFDMSYTFLIDKHQELIQNNNFEYIKQCDDEFTFYINTAYTQLHNMNNLRTVLTKTKLLKNTKQNLNPFIKTKQQIQLAAHALQNLSTLIQNNPKISYNFQVIYPFYLYLKLYIIINNTIMPQHYDANETITFLHHECLKLLHILFTLNKLSSDEMRNIINQALDYFDFNQKKELAESLSQEYFQLYQSFKDSLESREKTLEMLTEIVAIYESLNAPEIIVTQQINYLTHEQVFSEHVLHYLNYFELINFACCSTQAKQIYLSHLDKRVEYESKLIRTFEIQNKQLIQTIQNKRLKAQSQKDTALQLIQQFTISDFGELKSINHPNQIFDIFSKPFLILFDLPIKVNMSYWNTLKNFLLQPQSWTQISEFAPETIQRQKIVQIKTQLKNPNFDLVQLAKTSLPLLKFVNWLQGILILHQYLRQYCLADKEDNLTEEYNQIYQFIQMNKNIEIFNYYFDNYFKDISQIEYIEHVPDELLFDQNQKVDNNHLIKIEAQTIGISVSAFKLLYPICAELQKTPEFSDQASWVILFLNGENYTAWSIRQKQKKQEDLKLTELICIRFPGSSCAFNYRLQLQSDYENEKRFFLKAYHKKSRSYHLWTYRLKYIQRISEQDPSIFEKECELMKTLAQKDVHNYSIFHHIIICQRQCGIELLEWAMDLKETYKLMYNGQENEQEIDVKALLSLNQFMKNLL